MKTLKKVTALIPCYNEEKSISDLIRRFPLEQLRLYGYELTIIIIDNNSSDRTAEFARACGAVVLCEQKKGKGNAMRTGFFAVSKECDYVVMLDGDCTYRPEEIVRMLEPLSSDFCSVVLGSRLGGRMGAGSMQFLNRTGNWLYSHFVRFFYRVNVTDVLTGYFAWKREAIERLRPHLVSEGFALEMEMVTKMARLGEEIYSVPISYDQRRGTSSLRPFYDGMRILLVALRNLNWKPARKKLQRLVFVSDAIAPYHQGGKESRLYEITRRLVRDDREVHIYTMKWWRGPNTMVADGVHLHALSNYYPLYAGERRSIVQALLFGLATLKLLFVRFDTLDVDHIPFFPLLGARLVTWLRGKKLYGTWHEVWGASYWQEYLGGWKGSIGSLVEQLSLRVPDIIISVSDHTTKRLLEAGVAQKIIRTVSLGVSLEAIYAAEEAAEKSDVIFVGRLLKHKNADLLIKAIAIVKRIQPKIICGIVGDGPEKESLVKLIQTLGLSGNVLLFDAAQTPAKLYGLMKASRMLVLPSVREGFGLVAIEANAAGIPVITTSHPDNAAKDLIVNGVNGYVVAPDPASIAEKILELQKARRSALRPKYNLGRHDWSIVTKNMELALT